MQIAFLLFPGFTSLDAIGPYDVLSRIPGAEAVFVSERPGPVANEVGSLSVVAEGALGDASSPDILVVPGGPGTRRLLEHAPVLDWLRHTHERTSWTTSVCTGSLLLAAAGILEGLPAATHWLARDLLASLGAQPVPERVVVEGKIVTAAGVSSGIDMALLLVQRMLGDEAAQAIQLAIEYDPQPPFDSGSPEKAPPEIVSAVRSRAAAAL